jgi:hypothetical protein
MIQKTDLEVRKAAIIKAARMSIRLKHTLAADEEINEKLPALEQKIDTALQAGAGISMNPAHYLEG